jgi:uncharacterized protein YbjT (DUF2867 family)
MVLVVGATGLVGSEVCQKLARRGEKVRALVRESSSKEKISALQSSGVEIQVGDSIESVDAAGQLNLVNTAKSCNVHRFIFVSFRRSPSLSFPLADAKDAVEKAITALNFTTIQASWFMEVWLSPMLGFDYANATARIYGPGTAPISWVSFRDVAEMCAIALRHPAAERTTIEFGGPEALSPLDVVARFERIGGRPFKVEHVPEPLLRSQFQAAEDSLQKSFAALMLGYLHGDAMNMAPVVDKFTIKLTSVDDYARSVLSRAATV